MNSTEIPFDLGKGALDLMELRYLIEFVNLAESESFSETAELMYISQPSLSKHIKSLEKDLGFSLFERSNKRKVRLSEYGALFYPYAKQISQSWREFQLVQKQHEQSSQETLSIGFIPMLAQYQIADLIEQFQSQYPNIRIELSEAETSKAKSQLLNHNLDFAFVRESANLPRDEFNRALYVSDELVAVMPSSHPLAARKYVTLRQLAKEPFLLLHSGSMLYELCINECRRAGFEPNVIFQSTVAANILDMVRKGRGISLLNRRPVEPLLNSELMVVSISPAITTNINLIYTGSKHLSRAARDFLHFCAAFCQLQAPIGEER